MAETSLNISIFGLGYVGCVAAAQLASRGHNIIGVDIIDEKVNALNEGRATIHEPGLDELIAKSGELGTLSGTKDTESAIMSTDVSLICVGTPSTASGSLDLSYVRQVSEQISHALEKKSGKHLLVFRSTMLPGSTRSLVEAYFKTLISDGRAEVFFFPEFLRQGSAVKDLIDPSLSVIGAYDKTHSVEPLKALLEPSTVISDLETAELIKYACNAYHASKVSFANEIGRIAKSLGINGPEVMRILCLDTRLNISKHYLKPGIPYGGSCLTKDVSALTHFARTKALSVPTLESLLDSNEKHIEHLTSLVELTGKKKILLIGLSFKANTDDLRGSAPLELATRLMLRNFSVQIIDPLVTPDKLMGATKRFVDQKLPALDNLLVRDHKTAIENAEVLVVSNKCIDLAEIAAHVTAEHKIIDIYDWKELAELPATYCGICW